MVPVLVPVFGGSSLVLATGGRPGPGFVNMGGSDLRRCNDGWKTCMAPMVGPHQPQRTPWRDYLLLRGGRSPKGGLPAPKNVMGVANPRNGMGNVENGGWAAVGGAYLQTVYSYYCYYDVCSILEFQRRPSGSVKSQDTICLSMDRVCIAYRCTSQQHGGGWRKFTTIPAVRL